MDMNLLDIVVLALVALLGLKGLVRGLIKEVFGLVSIVGGVFFASRFAEELGSYIHTTFFPIENAGVQSLVGFVILFALLWAGIQLVGTILAKMVKISGLGFLDRLGGMAVGSAKIFLVFSIIAYGFGSVGFIQDMLKERLSDSMMYPVLYHTGSYIVSIDSLQLQDAKAKVEEKTGEIIQEAVGTQIRKIGEGALEGVKLPEGNITEAIKGAVGE